MNELAKLAPAQTLVILYVNEAQQKDLLKYTLMDLLLKKVLKVTKKRFRASKHDPEVELTYIVTGKNFSGYKHTSFEEIFLRPFLRSKNISILFRHIVKMGYENSIGKAHLQKLICSSYELNGCIVKSFLQNMFGGFSLSGKGNELRRKVKEELDYFNEYIPTVLTTDKQKALDALKYIKGNIFLLSNIVDFKLLEEIDKELSELNKRNETTYAGCSGCFTAWDSFDTHSHQFDSSCGSGDSGCSGSGCSGCGGGD